MPSTECKAKRNPARPSLVPSNSTCLIIAVIIESVLAHTCWFTQTAGECMRTEMMSLSSMHYIAIMKQCSLNSLCMQYRRVPQNHYVCVKIHRMAAMSKSQSGNMPVQMNVKKKSLHPNKMWPNEGQHHSSNPELYHASTWSPMKTQNNCLKVSMEAFTEPRRMVATITTQLTMSEPCPATRFTQTFPTLARIPVTWDAETISDSGFWV